MSKQDVLPDVDAQSPPPETRLALIIALVSLIILLASVFR